MLLKTVLLVLPIWSYATPVPDNHAAACVRQETATYDDIPSTEGGPNPIPSPYLGLDYQNFQVSQGESIQPASGDQFAIAFGGDGNISVPSASRGFPFFNLESFSYACDAGIPQPACQISVWGFRGTSLVAQRSIIYPALQPGFPITSYVMNSTGFDLRWSFLTSIGFSIARADDGGNFFGGLAIDNLKYIVNGGC